jgi:hypothetical protein
MWREREESLIQTRSKEQRYSKLIEDSTFISFSQILWVVWRVLELLSVFVALHVVFV